MGRSSILKEYRPLLLLLELLDPRLYKRLKHLLSIPITINPTSRVITPLKLIFLRVRLFSRVRL